MNALALAPSRFRSYDRLGEVRPEAMRAQSVATIQAAMEQAAADGRTLTFRGAGASFHDQSLSQDRLMVLDEMPRALRMNGTLLEADSRATVGDALSTALRNGALPPIIPTSRRITLGGCLASNVVSRFSPAYGKFSGSVEAFELYSPDGRGRHVVRPAPGTSTENDALFRAVPGSFGYLGYVSRLQLRTVALPFETATLPPRVETTPELVSGMDNVVDPLVRDYLSKNSDPARRQQVNSGRTSADSRVTWALTDPIGRGLVFHSRFVPGDRPESPFFLHRPHGLTHALGQLISASRLWIDFGWKYSWQRVGKRDQPFVDDLEGFAFMMDGNWRTRDWAARWGLNIWLLQQSFVLPIHPGRGDPGEVVKAFLEHIRREVHDARVKIGVIDLLTCPPDATLLSSVNGTGGVMVSLAVQGVSRKDAGRVIEVLRRLSRHCADLGGCVHLVKHVHAEPEVLREMYGPAFATFLSLKQQVDPRGILRNAFFDRLATACRG
jgi:FAD/FMN-containing dehydrogenase